LDGAALVEVAQLGTGSSDRALAGSVSDCHVTSAGWKHGQGLRVMVGWAEVEAAEKPALWQKLEPILGSGISARRAVGGAWR
jgi:hypothetical protein